MLATAHGLEGDRHVPLVGRADENCVDFWIAAQLLVVGIELDGLGQLGREAVHPILSQIAERDDGTTWVTGDRPPIDPSDTHPDDGYPYAIHCWSSLPKRDAGVYNKLHRQARQPRFVIARA